MLAYILFSGSSGNCTYIKSKKTEILIDAGRSERAIELALNSIGSSLKSISHIFITHEHCDHVGGLEVISKKHNIPVHITYPSYDKLVMDKSYLKRSALRHEVEYSITEGELSISSFRIPHDSAQNVGYVITDGSVSLGYATDIGHVTEEIAYALRKCKYVVLEANHDIEMLKNGNYPPHLKERILSQDGHLSNKNSARFACYLAENGTEYLTLAHLSRENNTEELAKNTVLELLKNNNLSLDVEVAGQNDPTLVTR